MENVIEIRWIASRGDPTKFSDEGMREQAKVVDALRDAGLIYEYPDPVMAYDGIDISFDLVITWAGVTSLARALTPIAVAFINGRAGRKVSAKIEGVEVEASSEAEVGRLFEKALEVRKRADE